jgi:Amt family ammonium transporter
MYQKKINIYNLMPFLVLSVIALLSIFAPPEISFIDKNGNYNTADIAWILTATALVFLMTPGLAFFYGGMVHRKNVISTMTIINLIANSIR